MANRTKTSAKSTAANLKSGISHFHGHATAYNVRKGHRFTMALTSVSRGEAMDEVVKRLLRLAAKAAVRPRYLLLDSGFYNVNVVRYLQAARCPFLMPTAFRGRKPENRRSGPSFRFWKQGGWSAHTWTNKDKKRATVLICVVCRNYKGQRKRHGRRRLIDAYWGMRPASLHWVYETYRARFGIETSYRQLNECRIRTCTRNPLIRFLIVALALLPRNVWVWLHLEILSTPRRGGRIINLERLRLKTLLTWLLHVAEESLQTNDELLSECPMPANT